MVAARERIIAQADIASIDQDQRLVFGWANIAMTAAGELVTDAHDDSIDPEDLELAAYAFCLQFRELNTNHQGMTTGNLVESFMVTPSKLVAMGLSQDALPVGWWVGFYIQDDAAWEGVKKGDFKMFSIEGWALREDV